MISIMLSEKSWGQLRLLLIRSTSPLQDCSLGFVYIFYLIIISIARFGLFLISLCILQTNRLVLLPSLPHENSFDRKVSIISHVQSRPTEVTDLTHLHKTITKNLLCPNFLSREWMRMGQTAFSESGYVDPTHTPLPRVHISLFTE